MKRTNQISRSTLVKNILSIHYGNHTIRIYKDSADTENNQLRIGYKTFQVNRMVQPEEGQSKSGTGLKFMTIDLPIYGEESV